MSQKNIEDIKFSLYKKSELLWWLSLAGWLIAAFASIASILATQKLALSLLGITSLFIPFCIVWLREIAATYSLKADKCRRMILYSDGLGNPPSEIELLTAKGYSIGNKIESAYYEPPYYDSKIQAGPARLLDIIGESAFFTKELALKIESYLRVILATSFLLIVALGLSSKFWIGLIEVTQESLADFIEAFTLFIATLVAGDIYLLKTKFSNMAKDSERVFSSAFKLKKSITISNHDVLTIASDYDACLQNSPPIPFCIYKRYVGDLNRIYKDVAK